MFNYDNFRISLKLKRKELKVTQDNIASATDISEKTISRIEQNDKKPSLETVIAILNYFNTSMEQFMSQQNDLDNEKANLINKAIYQNSMTKKNFFLLDLFRTIEGA